MKFNVYGNVDRSVLEGVCFKTDLIYAFKNILNINSIVGVR